MKILLISGHGAGDTGAVSAYGTEANETRTMAGMVRERLAKYAEVDIYPQANNCFQDNKNGRLQVDFRNYNYVLEFHMNQSAESRRGQGNGFEMLVHPAVTGVSVEQAIARKVCALGFAMRRDKGLWRTDGYLNMETCLRLGVDYALAETCFIDNKADMETYRVKLTQIADAYVAGIAEGFGLSVPAPAETPNPDAVMLRRMNTDQFIEYMGKLAQDCWEKYRLLPSVTIAQAMLESGIGKTELACGLGASEANIAKNGTAYGARNLFGIKRDVSKGTWESDVWSGDTYYKQTAEQRADGTYENIWAYFRRYETIAESVEDRAQYLTRAKTETGEIRFPGIAEETDPQKACEIIAAGAYATSLNYVKNLMARVNLYNLTRFDPQEYDCWTAKVVNAEQLNVRRTPNGEVMRLEFSTLPAIVVTGEAKDEDGDIWYQVKLGETVTGYVWSEYLSR